MTYCENWWEGTQTRAVGGFSVAQLARMAPVAPSEGLSFDDLRAVLWFDH
jgi:hypothetical protein